MQLVNPHSNPKKQFWHDLYISDEDNRPQDSEKLPELGSQLLRGEGRRRKSTSSAWATARAQGQSEVTNILKDEDHRSEVDHSLGIQRAPDLVHRMTKQTNKAKPATQRIPHSTLRNVVNTRDENSYYISCLSKHW